MTELYRFSRVFNTVNHKVEIAHNFVITYHAKTIRPYKLWETEAQQVGMCECAIKRMRILELSVKRQACDVQHASYAFILRMLSKVSRCSGWSRRLTVMRRAIWHHAKPSHVVMRHAKSHATFSHSWYDTRTATMACCRIYTVFQKKRSHCILFVISSVNVVQS